MAIVAGFEAAESWDTETLISAFEGLTFGTPKGEMTFRPEDHQALQSMYHFKLWLRANYAHFGDNSDAFWRRMADTSMRRTDSGRVTVHYDPAIVSQFGPHKADLDIWDTYDAVQARPADQGEKSDVLPVAVAESMTKRGPRPRLETIANCGHAPTLANSDQIAQVRAFVTE